MARVIPKTICALFASSVAACALLGAPRSAQAEPVVAPRSDTRTTTRPDRTLLSSGLWTLGLSYLPAFVVAVESPRTFDNHLYIPVAGPWMDYGRRSCPECKHETLNKVLLVTDGVFQGIGALQIVGSFLFPETVTSQSAAGGPPKKRPSVALRVVPSRFETGAYGLTAKAIF